MANEDDSVKSSSFAFLYGFLYLISFFIFPEKRLNMVSTRNKTQMCFLAEKNLCPPESASLFITFQKQRIRNGSGQFLLIVGYHNQGFILPRTECLDDILHQPAVTHIQSVQRLVQNQ